ncbi:MAG: alpha/beta hydrolase [Proteobacteria bacterium]|nr:alpha/beta hydrolase [Pseudomonadota bacterium]
MPVPLLRAARLLSYDETELTWYEGGRRDGVPMILCNGLGAGWQIWAPLVERFAEEFRILSWDYRGIYGSGPALDPEDYALTHHVRDLLFLLERERVKHPVLLGWSMGTQVALELHRTHPDLARGLVLLNGVAGHPLRLAFDSPRSEQLARVAFRLMRVVGRGFNGLGGLLAGSRLVSDGFVSIGQWLRVMAPDLDRDRFQEIAVDWAQLDLRAYAEIFELLNEHDAADLLASISTPTLVIAGGQDRFIPEHRARDLAKRLPRAELHVVPAATHFGLLEYPEEINDAVERYLRETLGIVREPKAS